jgi:hypothetical protein
MKGMRGIFWLTLITAAISGAILALTPEHPGPPGGFRSSLVALQFVKGWPELTTLLAVDRTGYWRATWLDFANILAYGAMYVLAGRALRSWIVPALAIAAALSDGCENLATLRVLPIAQGFTDTMAAQIHGWAVVKFLLLAGVWMGLGLKWWFRGKWREAWKTPAIPYLGAGVWTLMSLAFRESAIEVVAVPVAVAWGIQAWIYRPWAARTAAITRATASGSSELM